MKTSTRSFATTLLIAALVVPAVPAQAESFATAAALAGDRELIAAVLARAQVQAQLQVYGVNAAEASARVAALSDEEATELAAQIEELPAGGNPAAIVGAFVAAGYALVVVVVAAVGAAALIGYGAVKLLKKAGS